jgi:hypothetical protein
MTFTEWYTIFFLNSKASHRRFTPTSHPRHHPLHAGTPKVALSQSKRSARWGFQARTSPSHAPAANATRTSGNCSDGWSTCITTSWTGMVVEESHHSHRCRKKNKNLIVSTQHISVMNDEREIKFHSRKSSSSRGLGGDCDDEMRWWLGGGRRVNKFDKFYRNLSKFDGFGPHRISKSMILLFTYSKY